MRLPAHALAGAPAPLAAAAQMHAQPIPHEVIEAAKRWPRVAQAKTVGPAPQIPADAHDRGSPADAGFIIFGRLASPEFA